MSKDLGDASIVLWSPQAFQAAPLVDAFDRAAGLFVEAVPEAKVSELVPQWGGEAPQSPGSSPSRDARRHKDYFG